MNIKDLIGETTEYEKKVALETKKPKSWCKTISAFANGKGGILIFGVDDNDNIVGLTNMKKDSEDISEIIKTHLNPIPKFDMSFNNNDFILTLFNLNYGVDDLKESEPQRNPEETPKKLKSLML
jgi:predicted HTH transcriptional regulator